MEFDYPEDLRYLDSHEYVRLDGEIATIGLSAYAIDELGDIVFLELPDEGEAVEVRVLDLLNRLRQSKNCILQFRAR